MRAVVLAALCAAFVALQGAWAAPLSSPIRGVAVTPYSEVRSAGVTFDSMVDEIAALGASDISVVVQWSQRDVHATQIAPHAKETQDDAVVRKMLRRAHEKGLRTTLFPIIWMEQRAPGKWRGTIAPSDVDAWWAAYRRFILHYARIAAEEDVALFSVGSELNSMEVYEAQWRALIEDVRKVYRGRLTYSANWDHFEHVRFWDALDLLGVTAYFELAQELLPTEAALTEAWLKVREVLLDFQARHGRPLLITEVGWPSQVGAAQRPWNYVASAEVDLEVQRRCYAAFVAAWRTTRDFGGVLFWNWWGPGGERDRDYTPRRKPAERHLRAFFSP